MVDCGITGMGAFAAGIAVISRILDPSPLAAMIRAPQELDLRTTNAVFRNGRAPQVAPVAKW